MYFGSQYESKHNCIKIDVYNNIRLNDDPFDYSPGQCVIDIDTSLGLNFDKIYTSFVMYDSNIKIPDIYIALCQNK